MHAPCLSAPFCCCRGRLCACVGRGVSTGQGALPLPQRFARGVVHKDKNKKTNNAHYWLATMPPHPAQDLLHLRGVPGLWWQEKGREWKDIRKRRLCVVSPQPTASSKRIVRASSQTNKLLGQPLPSKEMRWVLSYKHSVGVEENPNCLSYMRSFASKAGGSPFLASCCELS